MSTTRPTRTTHPTTYLVATFVLKKKGRPEVKYRKPINPRKTEEANLIDLCHEAVQKFGKGALKLDRWVDVTA